MRGILSKNHRKKPLPSLTLVKVRAKFRAKLNKTSLHYFTFLVLRNRRKGWQGSKKLLMLILTQHLSQQRIYGILMV